MWIKPQSPEPYLFGASPPSGHQVPSDKGLARPDLTDKTPGFLASLLNERLALSLLLVALTSVGFVLLSAVSHRFQWISTPALLNLFYFILTLTSLLFSFSLFLLVYYRVKRKSVHNALFQAMILCGVLLSFPAYFAWTSRNLPATHDVSTNWHEPPTYGITAQVRSPGANRTDDLLDLAKNRNNTPYAELRPLDVNISPERLFPLVLSTAEGVGWTRMDFQAPAGPGTEGRLEATDKTKWLGFRDDIVIRVRRNGQGSRVDVRSSSRYGSHDFGTNAERIRQFFDRLKAKL